MFLKPKSMAVPMDITMLVDDAFRGRLDGTEPKDPEGFVMTDIGIAAVCEAVVAEAEPGFYDEGIIIGDMGVMLDRIHTAAVMARMAGDKSINRIVDGFPEYLCDRKVRECQYPVESFKHAVDEAVPGMEGRAMVRTDAWHVDRRADDIWSA